MDNPPEVPEDSLLLSEDFVDEMMEMYSPTRQKSSSDSKPAVPQSNKSFPVKFLNIMDPLLPTNNLGRSVSKASFARIRKALAHGAQSLTNIVAKVNSCQHSIACWCILHVHGLTVQFVLCPPLSCVWVLCIVQQCCVTPTARTLLTLPEAASAWCISGGWQAVSQ